MWVEEEGSVSLYCPGNHQVCCYHPGKIEGFLRKLEGFSKNFKGCLTEVSKVFQARF